ncbi:flavodoxin and radical SAM domain-containing protein [Fusarium austroafricanum]|uniref:Flavodoxin and radical SAM domain-containing protein n=1 Tax=Fusarium austroafricanum TaxID=2364996 RepID=A0A8H4NSL0_9HYPO|nr:flavodoxin and radical SAM domain-containing protein [Fusarium austroafricanum]
MPHETQALGWQLRSQLTLHSPEFRLGKNLLYEVPDREINEGGPQRGVVHLKVTHHSKTVSEGTGFLIDDEVVVTAAHLLIPRHGPRRYDPAIAVSVSAGIGGDTVERRQGTWALVHMKWVANYSYLNDVGLIRLSGIFHGVTPLPYKTTPLSDGGLTGVAYGYPENNHMDGIRLYQSQSLFWFAGGDMLLHEADTDHGSSGSPFIIDDNGEKSVIAIHSCGHAVNGSHINKATPLNHNGNDMGVLLHIVKYMMRSPIGHRIRVSQNGRPFTAVVISTMDGYTTYGW